MSASCIILESMEEQDHKEKTPSSEHSAAPDAALSSIVGSGKTPEKRALWKRIVVWTLTALFILAIALAVLFVVHVKRADKPFLFGKAVYRVVSESMEPIIMTGDVIIVEEVGDLSELKVGDVITYRAKEGAFKNLPAGTPVTHRIVKIEGSVITTKGDNDEVAPVPDKPISFDDVIGRYSKTSAPLTKISALFFSRYGFVIVVFIPLMILLAVQVVNFIRACRMDDEGKTVVEKTAEEVAEQTIKDREAELKRKAIEEYLASRKRIDDVVQNRSDKDRKGK